MLKTYLPIQSRTNRLKRFFFSLIEIMIAIAILTMCSGAVLFKLNRLIEQKQFETDRKRLESLFIFARNRAIHSKMDWKISLQAEKSAWNVKMICSEDFNKKESMKKLGDWEFLFIPSDTEKLIKPHSLNFEFFSSGSILPKGTLILQGKKNKNFSAKIEVPAFWGFEENQKTPPTSTKETSK